MFKKIKLKNNVRLILAPRRETESVSLFVMIRIGSRYEAGRVSGISHFIEHLMFKGTKKRPNTSIISRELDSMGADFNAFTGKEYTGYYIKSDVKHLDRSIDILSDMLLNSKLEKSEVERERGVILEEIKMYEDNPRLYLDSFLELLMFSNNPLGRLISGTRKTVRGTMQNDLVNFLKDHYKSSEIVISLAGKFNEKKAISEIESKFKFKKSSQKNTYKKFKVIQNKPRVDLQFKDTQQVNLAIGFPAYAYEDPKIYPLTLLATILGGGMSSRLFEIIRERNGLAYSIKSDLTIYQDVGGLTIEAGLDKMRIDKAVSLIMNELKKIKKGVSSEELTKAKEQIAGKTSLEMEDSAQLASWYARDELLTGKILTPKEKVAKIMEVTEEEVKKVAQEVINFNRLNLAVIGPFKNKKRFEKLVRISL